MDGFSVVHTVHLRLPFETAAVIEGYTHKIGLKGQAMYYNHHFELNVVPIVPYSHLTCYFHQEHTVQF